MAMEEPSEGISSFFDFSTDFAGKKEEAEIFAAVAEGSAVAMKKKRQRKKKKTSSWLQKQTILSSGGSQQPQLVLGERECGGI